MIAKECSQETSPEDFAIKLARHFVTFYDVVRPSFLLLLCLPCLAQGSTFQCTAMHYTTLGCHCSLCSEALLPAPGVPA